MNKDLFYKELEKLGITISEEQYKQLELFYDLLIEWNNKINLTGITVKEDVYLKHFYDSLTLFRDIELNKEISICDVGTGAGFPGIVLKIVFPNLKITLIDSLNKRIVYLNEVINKLGLKDIEAIHTRMEDYSKLNEEKYDYITARAVSNLRVLSEICVKSVKLNGYLVFMKGNLEEELYNIDTCLNKLGLSIEKIDRFNLPVENSNRSIILLKKNKKTLDIYPRSVDKIKKLPL